MISFRQRLERILRREVYDYVDESVYDPAIDAIIQEYLGRLPKKRPNSPLFNEAIDLARKVVED